MAAGTPASASYRDTASPQGLASIFVYVQQSGRSVERPLHLLILG
jgi:hypothetical protein